MPGAAQTSAIRQLLNNRAYNIHIGQRTTDGYKQMGVGLGYHAVGPQQSID